MNPQLFVGVDIGTQGVRVTFVDAAGMVVARARRGLVRVTDSTGLVEQDARDWLTALSACFAAARRDVDVSRVRALSVCAQSGTLCTLDEAGTPVRSAMLYSDRRAAPEAAEVRAALNDPRIDVSFALPKVVWLLRQLRVAPGAHIRFAGAAEYVCSWLTGEPPMADYSQAMKLGYDVESRNWPKALEARLGIDTAWLPRVGGAGEIVGRCSETAAAALGLPRSAEVRLGTTDGVAALVAAGLPDWMTVLGTTLVWKGVAPTPLYDPNGLLYNHLGPGELWLPGAASNCGAAILDTLFEPRERRLFGDRMTDRPSGVSVYPLSGVGERFPFRDPTARSFVTPKASTLDRAQLYVGCLEGIAYVERLGYEVITAAGGVVGSRVVMVGGASHNDRWLQLRANVLQREVMVPSEPESAFGAALLALASVDSGRDLAETVRRAVRIEKVIKPEALKAGPYEDAYQGFLDECDNHGMPVLRADHLGPATL